MSNIEWTDETWTPVKGCTRASEGCDNCYAVKMTHRLEAMGRSKYAGLTVLNPKGERHFNGVVRCDDDAVTVPLRWKKPRKVFVSSMSDIFHKDVPFEFLDRIFAVMALCPQHTFQVLTKRPERMAEFFGRSGIPVDAITFMGKVIQKVPRLKNITMGQTALHIHDGQWRLPNVWLGTSVENQEQADKRIPHLLRCPAAVRFLSCEPLLGDVDLTAGSGAFRIGTQGVAADGVDWVIAGGESGPGARPCDVAWIRSIVSQCKGVGVPVFVKQLGSAPFFEDHAYCRACSKWDHADNWDLCKKSYTNHEVADGVLNHGVAECSKITRTYTSGPQRLNDPKGGDPAEWPEDLRVREMPKEVADGR